MIPLQRWRSVQRACGALGLLAVAGAARAQILVTPSVTFASGLYSYDYTIANNSSDDIYDIAINVTPGAGTILDLTVPTGFLGNYDPGFGIVDFLSDSSVFGAGTALGGFTFESPLPPAPSTYAALTLDITTFGPTQSPVPEPGLPALIAGIGSVGLIGWRQAKRRGMAQKRSI